MCWQARHVGMADVTMRQQLRRLVAYGDMYKRVPAVWQEDAAVAAAAARTLQGQDFAGSACSCTCSTHPARTIPGSMTSSTVKGSKGTLHGNLILSSTSAALLSQSAANCVEEAHSVSSSTCQGWPVHCTAVLLVGASAQSDRCHDTVRSLLQLVMCCCCETRCTKAFTRGHFTAS